MTMLHQQYDDLLKENLALQQQLASARQEIDAAMKVLAPNMPESGLVDACRQVKQVAISEADNSTRAEQFARAQVLAQVKALIEDVTGGDGYSKTDEVWHKLNALQPDPSLACLPLNAREQALRSAFHAGKDSMSRDPDDAICGPVHMAEARRLLQLESK